MTERPTEKPVGNRADETERESARPQSKTPRKSSGPTWPAVRVINVVGLDRVNRDMVDRLIAFVRSEVATEEQLLSTRRNLLSSGWFEEDVVVEGYDTGNVYIRLRESPLRSKKKVDWQKLRMELNAINLHSHYHSKGIVDKYVSGEKFSADDLEKRNKFFKLDKIDYQSVIDKYVENRRFHRVDEAIAYINLLKFLDRDFHRIYNLDVSIIEHQIDKNKQFKESIDAREERLAEFALEHRGAGIVAFHRMLFPELRLQTEQVAIDAEDGNDRIPLPSVAPELWPGGRATSEKPPNFVQRVYEPWIGRGLTLAHLRRIDQPLVQALYHYERKNGPSGLNLPTKEEQNSAWVSRVEREGIGAALQGLEGEESGRAYQRLQRTRQRRAQKEGREGI